MPATAAKRKNYCTTNGELSAVIVGVRRVHPTAVLTAVYRNGIPHWRIVVPCGHDEYARDRSEDVAISGVFAASDDAWDGAYQGIAK